MQHKIPQEMNVEDKIIGPFTLKQFGFVFVAVVVTVIVMALLMNLGMSTITAVIIGAFFGSFSLLICFVPYNGRPVYTHIIPFAIFISKPRQRVWKKENDQGSKPQTDQVKSDTIQGQNLPPKAPLENAEGEIEKISLMVDTGGAYGLQNKVNEIKAETVFDKGDAVIDQSLEDARKKVEAKQPGKEPLISEMASINPAKKYNYKKPDITGYKIEEE